MNDNLVKIQLGDLVKIKQVSEASKRVAVLHANKKDTVLLSMGTLCTVMSEPYTITSHFTGKNEFAVDCLTWKGLVHSVHVKWLTELCDN